MPRSPFRSRPSSDSTARPRGNIIAVVAVLLIHIERKQVTPAYTTTSRSPLDPTHADASAVNASRRSRRCAIMPFGEDEAADEQKNDGIGERRVRDLRGGDAEDDAQRRPEQRGDGERQRLRHPEHDHQREHGPDALRGRSQRARQQQNRDRQRRSGDQAECLAPSIERFLRRRVSLGRHAADIMVYDRPFLDSSSRYGSHRGHSPWCSRLRRSSGPLAASRDVTAFMLPRSQSRSLPC